MQLLAVVILFPDAWSFTDLQVQKSISCIHADLQTYVLYGLESSLKKDPFSQMHL